MEKKKSSKQLIPESDGSWSGSPDEGKEKKKPSVSEVHEHIVDRASKTKSTKKTKSTNIMPAQNEEQKEDQNILKSTRDQTLKGLRKQVVLDKKFVHALTVKEQFDAYDPFGLNVHHPLRTVLESTGPLIVGGERKGFSSHKGWRNCALCVPFKDWATSVL